MDAFRIMLKIVFIRNEPFDKWFKRVSDPNDADPPVGTSAPGNKVDDELGTDPEPQVETVPGEKPVSASNRRQQLENIFRGIGAGATTGAVTPENINNILSKMKEEGQFKGYNLRHTRLTKPSKLPYGLVRLREKHLAR